MNQYEMIAKNYKALMKRDDSNISNAYYESKIKVYTLLANLTESEIIEIFNSGAFNDVLKGYCKAAMKNCNIPDDKIKEVMEELKWLLDTMSAEEAEKHS